MVMKPQRLGVDIHPSSETKNSNSTAVTQEL
jgi:hypothetical protein